MENQPQPAPAHSPFAPFLQTAPRVVTTTAEVVSQAAQVAEAVQSPLQRLSTIFGGGGAANTADTPPAAPNRLTGRQSQPTTAQNGDEDDEPYIPLTADEIKSKAVSRTEIAAGLIAMLFGFMNRYVAEGELKKEDRELLKAWETHQRGRETLSDDLDWQRAEKQFTAPAHPIWAAQKRWYSFQESVKQADEDAKITDYQRDVLRQAFEAELKALNKRGQAGTDSIWLLLIQISVIKAAFPMANLHKKRLLEP